MPQLTDKKGIKNAIEEDIIKAKIYKPTPIEHGVQIREEINGSILDDLVLKEIHKKGVPAVFKTHEEIENRVRFGLHNLDWDSREFRYHLS